MALSILINADHSHERSFVTQMKAWSVSLSYHVTWVFRWIQLLPSLLQPRMRRYINPVTTAQSLFFFNSSTCYRRSKTLALSIRLISVIPYIYMSSRSLHHSSNIVAYEQANISGCRERGAHRWLHALQIKPSPQNLRHLNRAASVVLLHASAILMKAGQ